MRRLIDVLEGGLHGYHGCMEIGMEREAGMIEHMMVHASLSISI